MDWGVSMKFKVGDKVRILPSAINICVNPSEVGVIATIKKIYSPIQIIIRTPTQKFGSWVVHEEHIESIIKPGQQLVFAFMEED